ncbi:MAG: exo-beta-N-acetylmuramidase NamZ domain-containing protein [Verrucomicrobiota bacterium]|jgi:uncharacterized protein YbbC (DUF1343 family)/CubicO group peptidase (beta-lactamase class C family)
MKNTFHYWLISALCLLSGTACQTTSQSQDASRSSLPSSSTSAPAPVSDVVLANSSQTFLPGHLTRLDQAVEQAMKEGKLPGGVLWFQHGDAVYRKTYGSRSVDPQREAMTEDTIFDAASLTKVIATTPAIMKLVESGKVEVDAPVVRYIPAFGAHDKDQVTVRHLMTHTSGLRPGLSLKEPWEGIEEAVRRACDESLQTTPGTKFRYSDINFILLGEIVSRVSGQPLEAYAAEQIFEPLGMQHTRFLPATDWISRIAPTTKLGDAYIRGVVHDPTSRRMGGVAGHAGLFTCTRDLARFARMMLGKGAVDDVRVFRPETVDLMTHVQSPAEADAQRGLGWDIASPYSSPRGHHFPIGSYGHTGWTGTSIWIVPQTDTFLIFLSNRNHPTEDGTVVALRRTLATIAAEAIPGYVDDPAAPALNGVDALEADGFRQLRVLKVGLITNHTGHNRNRQSTIDLLHAAESVELKALFSPEHGIRGKLDGKVEDGVDSKTGLKIHSLYGEHRQPQAADLEGLDALVFDIQDIGCRFYTYISTMGLAMEAAAKAGLKFVVLDRINPINGKEVEGPVLIGETDFVGFHAIPIRHGMTVGELALMFQKEKGLDLDLQIVPVRNWDRTSEFDAVRQPWTSPSPNMRNLKEALLYPGIGILETTNLSVGRGTDTPFELIGAPYIHDLQLTKALNDLAMPGVAFTPIQFAPDASVFKDETCQGVYISILDRSKVRPVELGIQIARTLHALYPGDWKTERLNRLLKHAPTFQLIESDASLESITGTWAADLDAFKARRAECLLYR